MKTSVQPLKARFQESLIEAGIDEAGRGCLAGPVVAAAVILPPGFNDPELNDSKKLTEIQRDRICKRIKLTAFAWAIAVVDNVRIDEINILQATYLAMHKAVNFLINPIFYLSMETDLNLIPALIISVLLKEMLHFRLLLPHQYLPKHTGTN